MASSVSDIGSRELPLHSGHLHIRADSVECSLVAISWGDLITTERRL